MEKIDRIICLGNESDHTAHSSRAIAGHFDLPFNGQLCHSEQFNPGCYHTSLISTVSLPVWRKIADRADLVIKLDQPKSSFKNIDCYYKTQTNTRWFAHFKSVIVENFQKDLYITQYYRPSNQFNTEIIHCGANQDIEKELVKHDVNQRRVVLQFMNIQDTTVDEFIALIDRVVCYCRKNQAQFIIMRGDQHEHADIHFEITYYLTSLPEFCLLATQQQIDKDLGMHWNRLYKQ